MISHRFSYSEQVKGFHQTERQIAHGLPLFVCTDVVTQQIGNIDMKIESTGAKFGVRHFIDQIKKKVKFDQDG